MARVKDTGYVNPQEVYNYLVNVKGLSREHALGMLSNIQAESGFKIAVQEYGKPQGTGGVGLFQHTGPRRQALVKYTGGDVNDWTKQVDFALQEGVTKTYLSQKFETPEEASIWFTTKWERPANANQRAQERLKYLNNYSNFSGYESTYQPSSSSSSQGAGQNAQQGAAQMPIPFEVVIAGKPQQVAFSYEDFQKALATTQKEEEKEQESEARQELKQEMTTQEAFLKAMESISLPSASSQGNQQQQVASADMAGYEPLPIPEVSTALPQLPNIFSTQLPEMVDGGKVYSVKGEKFYKGPDGNWYRGESMNPQQRIYDKGTLNYINANAASSTPTNQGPQGAAKPVTNKAVWKEAQKQGEQELAAKQMINDARKLSGTAGLYMPDGSLKPQAAQAADWVPQAFVAGRPVLAGLEAVMGTSLGGNLTVGNVVNAAAGVQGASQADDRFQDWQAVYEGNMTWQEAALKTGITGLELAGGMNELTNLGLALKSKYATTAADAISAQQLENSILTANRANLINGKTAPQLESAELETISLARGPRGTREIAQDPKKPIWLPAEPVSKDLEILRPGRYTEQEAFAQGREIAKIQLAEDPTQYISLKGTLLGGDPNKPAYYFSANMADKQNAARSFATLSKLIPKGASITEPHSLSLDSFGTFTKRTQNSEQYTTLPGSFVPLNKSAVHTKLPNQDKVIDTDSPLMTFGTREDAEEAVKFINTNLVPEKLRSAIKAKVSTADAEGKTFQIMLPTVTLRKEFRKGGQTSPQDTKEMLDGIADILRQVVNVNNRKAIAKNMIGDFNREGLDYDLNNFLRSSRVKMLEGGPVKPPTFNLSYNPYVYNPNELTGYRGYGDLSGTSLGVSTPDLLGREKKINALKVPFSASVNRLYDPNVQNTTIDYSDQQNLNQGMTAEQLQTGAQQQLDSASQPYLDKNPLGFNIQTGVSGSGLNSNVKRRTKIDASVGVGYNPLSGFNAGASGKFSFALGNDFYRPLKNTGDWRAVGNIQPFGMSVNQLSAYNEQQDMIQSNLQQVASTGAYSDLTQNVNNYDNTKPGVASGVQFTLGAGVDGSVKLPIGMLNAGAGLKYNRAAGEAERLSPTAYVGYSVSGAELSRLGNKLPNINLPDSRRSNYETLANQDLETEKGEWVQGPDGQFTWRDFPGFNGAFNASTFEGEDIYVPTVLPNKQNGGVVKTFALF